MGSVRFPSFKSHSSSWTLVAIWTGLIFLTIPFARALQASLERIAGPHVYLVATAIVGSICALAALIVAVRDSRDRIVQRAVGLVLVGGVSVWMLHTQLQTPIEAIHFLEYGILGFLLFRAWRHTVRDPSIYPLAALGLALVAWADEFLQWFTPARFWDYRDLRLNMMAGVVPLLFIAAVFSNPGIQGPVARRSVRGLCFLSWAMLLALGIAVFLTPSRVDSFAARIPALRFLRNNESVMTEYGYRHVDPEIGVFFSRLTLSELLRIDRERGPEVGGILVRDRALANPREFRKTFAISADPFRHELFRHLIQRDHYFAASWKYREPDPARFAYHLAVVIGENRILEKYFPNALDAAGGRWGGDRLASCSEFADRGTPYVSEVNNHLVTVATGWELGLALLGLAGLVGWGWVRYGRAPSR